MTKDYDSLPLTTMRRTDRAVENETWIREFLRRAAWGVLATEHDGQPFINSNLFVFDEATHSIFLHTARTGRTRANLEQNPRACFHVAEMGRLLPADTALEFSVEYAGVTVFGACRVVGDPVEATRGLQLLLDKYFSHLKPGQDYRPIIDAELAQTTVLCVEIEAWSAKRKAVSEDFPGAFQY